MYLPSIAFAGSQTTHELQPGDLVITHGMRCLIDQDIVVSQSHPTNEFSPVLWTRAQVLNPEQVQADRFVPYGWLFDNHWVEGRGWVRGDELGEQPRWTIQGNGLARWYVVRLAGDEYCWAHSDPSDCPKV